MRVCPETQGVLLLSRGCDDTVPNYAQEMLGWAGAGFLDGAVSWPEGLLVTEFAAQKETLSSLAPPRAFRAFAAIM